MGNLSLIATVQNCEEVCFVFVFASDYNKSVTVKNTECIMCSTKHTAKKSKCL